MSVGLYDQIEWKFTIASISILVWTLESPFYPLTRPDRITLYGRRKLSHLSNIGFVQISTIIL